MPQEPAMPKTILTSKTGKAIGPYSLGVAAGDYVFLSGQIPLDGATGKLVDGGIEAQTEQVFANIKALLDNASVTMAQVVKATVFMTDLKDFAAMNAVYERHVPSPYPARSTIQVAGLPMGAKVEIEMLAWRG
jgi:2-iminobutanoate/2-iminopropanoate deaminase